MFTSIMVTDRKTQIYLDYDKKVMGYLRSHLTNVQDAEDLHSAVFEKVYRNLDRFDESKASLSTWIYTIAQNTLTDFFRVRHIHSELEETVAVEDNGMDDICKQETLEELADALEELTERERDIIILHYFKGVSLKDIAVKMDMSYSNMKLVHNKALFRLREKLACLL